MHRPIIRVCERNVNGAENGAERVENQAIESGAVSRHSRKCLSGSGAESGLNRPLSPLTHNISLI